MELSVFNYISQTKVLVFGRKINCFVARGGHGCENPKTKSATEKLSFICGNCNPIKFSKHANCEWAHSTNIDAARSNKSVPKLVCIISLALICSKCNCSKIHLACHWLNKSTLQASNRIGYVAPSPPFHLISAIKTNYRPMAEHGRTFSYMCVHMYVCMVRRQLIIISLETGTLWLPSSSCNAGWGGAGYEGGGGGGQEMRVLRRRRAKNPIPCPCPSHPIPIPFPFPLPISIPIPIAGQTCPQQFPLH